MAWTTADRGAFGLPDGTTAIVLSEEAVDDSDKVLDYDTDIGTGQVLYIDSIHLEWTTTATAGNREPVIELRDSADDVISRVEAQTVVPASQTGATYIFAPGMAPHTSGTPTRSVPESLPANYYITAGQSMRIYDIAAVAAGADDLVIHVRGRVG